MWEYLPDKEVCILHSAEPREATWPRNDSFFAMKNCKEGRPLGDLILLTRIFNRILRPRNTKIKFANY